MTTIAMTALIVGVMVLPAVPAAWVLTRKIQGGASAIVVIAFTLCVGTAGLTSMISWGTGLGLGASAAAYLAIVAVLDVVLVVRAGGLQAVPFASEYPVAIISGIVAIIAWWERAWMTANMDVFYHLAAARSMQFFDSGVITDPFYGVGGPGPDPTAGALNVLLGLTSKLSGVDPAALWTGLNLFAAVLTPLVFWVLFWQLRASRRGAIVGVIALTFLQTTADFRMAAYPNRVGMLVMIVAIAGLAAAVRGRRGGVTVAIAGAFSAAAIHTGIALAMLVVAGVVTVGVVPYARRAEPERADRSRLIRRVVFSGVGMIIAVLVSVAPRLWFAFSSSGSGAVDIPSSSTGLAERGLYYLFGTGVMFDPQAAFTGGALVLLVGSAIAVASFPVAVRRKDHLLALAAAVTLVPVIVGFNPVITPMLVALSPYMAWRTLRMFGFAPVVMLPLIWKPQPFLARLLLVAAVVAALPAFHVQFTDESPVAIKTGMMNVSIWEGWERDARYGRSSIAIGGIAEVIGDEWPLIATDEVSGYDMCGFMPCRVVVVPTGHSPAFMERTGEGQQRRDEMNALFDPRMAETSRGNIVRDWNVDYVLLWPDRVDEETRREMIEQTDVFEVAYESWDITLLEVVDR